jgi:polysaccharide export outer membrane protein
MARMLLSALALVLFGSLAAAQDYLIRPGDLLRIEVLEDASLNRDVLVLPDGKISVPQMGTFAAGGKSLSAVQIGISAGLAPNFAAAPTVFVTVSRIAEVTPQSTGGSTMDVFVMGEVNQPGKASIERGTSILQFLAEVGGFTRFAATKRIQLRRSDPKTGQQTVYGFNYHAIVNGSAGVSAMILHEGDVILVPERRLFE